MRPNRLAPGDEILMRERGERERNVSAAKALSVIGRTAAMVAALHRIAMAVYVCMSGEHKSAATLSQSSLSVKKSRFAKNVFGLQLS